MNSKLILRVFGLSTWDFKVQSLVKNNCILYEPLSLPVSVSCLTTSASLVEQRHVRHF